MTKLKDALAEISDQFGEGALSKLGSNHRAPLEAIPTGSRSLDAALGIGGVPRGRIVEIFGPESSGKTTLTCHIIAEAQKAGGTAAFIDAEQTFDPAYAEKIGVDTKNLYFNQPDHGEQGLQIVDTLLRSSEMDVIVVDSVAGLTPRAEMDGDVGDAHVGLLARLMSQATRKFANRIGKTKTALVFTNQIRMNVNTAGYGGSPETQPGGRALRFHAAQRLDIRRIETLKSGEEAVGIRVRVKVVKNKTASPYRQAEFCIDYGLGISKEAEVLDAGLKAGLIVQSGSYYAYKDTNLAQGKENTKAHLRENPDLTQTLLDALDSL